MSNLFFKLDIETEVFANGKVDSFESVEDIVLRYSGFTDVQHEYDIYISANDFIGDFELQINKTKPYIVKIQGLAKVKPKKDLLLNILEDKKPKIYLLQVNVDSYDTLETNSKIKPTKMICDFSSKKF